MATVRAPQGDGSGDWIDWVELGGENAIVAISLTEWGADKDFGNGPAKVAVCDVLILTGTYTGVVKRNEEIIGKGITTPLSKVGVGDTMAARIETKKRGTTTYAIAQTPSDEEFEMVDKIMEDPAAFIAENAADEPPAKTAPATTTAAKPAAKRKPF